MKKKKEYSDEGGSKTVEREIPVDFYVFLRVSEKETPSWDLI